MSPMQVRMVTCVTCNSSVTVARAEPLQVNNVGGLWICRKCAANPQAGVEKRKR